MTEKMTKAERAELERLPSVETLMPSIDATEIKALIDARHRERD